jgi:hypothetical protein
VGFGGAVVIVSILLATVCGDENLFSTTKKTVRASTRFLAFFELLQVGQCCPIGDERECSSYLSLDGGGRLARQVLRREAEHDPGPTGENQFDAEEDANYPQAHFGQVSPNDQAHH